MAPWYVLGPGALGCLWAANLARAGIPVVLLVRDASCYPGQITVWRDSRVDAIAVPAENADAPGPAIDHVLVTVKAHQTVSALSGLADRLGPQSLIVLMQNGLGVPEALRQKAIPGRVVQAFTTEGAYRTNPYQAVHGGRGITLLPAAEVDAIATLGSGSIQVAGDADIERRLWLKLAVNCVINPLTALLGCTNGELLHEPALVDSLCEEIARISALEGYRLETRELVAEVNRIAGDTASNRSSMLQDIEAGRATEIGFITGHLLRCADYRGVDLPLNRQLAGLVLAREHASERTTFSPHPIHPHG